ncbi:unnamed protein product [Urochloa decumbens]|uniref:F-box domain-containing protein n=1 Tax=Urochloa decumbens TaxID=240449 RepID=A0ABC8YQ72_9POAL
MSSPPSPPESWRDYSALPRNVLLDIFSRVPHADILRGAGLVCAPWRRLAVAEPALWRHIDLSAAEDKTLLGRDAAPAHWQAMSRAAVDHSAGQCESFRGRADSDFLAYLADSWSPDLRSIHVTSWIYVTERGFVDGVIKKLPLLERLVMWRGFFPGSSEVMRAFLDHCPRLDLLDLGGCYNSYAVGYRTRERCQRTIRNLRLPKTDPSGCSCCVEYSQDYADKHDYELCRALSDE